MSYQQLGVDVTATATVPQFTVGSKYEDQNGKVYKYVRYKVAAGLVAAVAGNVCYYYAPSGASAGATTDVTSDLSDSANLAAATADIDAAFKVRPCTSLAAPSGTN